MIECVKILTEIVTAIVVPVAITTLTIGIRKKLGVEIQEAHQKKLEQIAVNAVYRIEERAMHNNDNQNDKHNAAVKELLRHEPKMDLGSASDLIKNTVSRLPDVGAFKP